MKVRDKIYDSNKICFIAEAGINHNGDIELAKDLIDVAIEAKADAVKFQTFNTDNIIIESAPKAEYQKNQIDKSQYELLKKHELSEKEHKELINYCKNKDIVFLSTPFDKESANLLNKLDLPIIKVGSGDLNNYPLLKHIASFGKPMIVSTGMGNIKEVKNALSEIQNKNHNIDIIFLHCTSEYPIDIEDVNLRAMETMKEELNVPIGYSDHTVHIETPSFAVATGAQIVEKHFTLDKSLQGPDHKASLEPDELKKAVKLAKLAVKARGKSEKSPTKSELKNKNIVRKSIYAAKKIHKGERITEDNICIKRPSTGLSPSHYKSIIGKKVKYDLKKDDPITEKVI